MTHQEDYNLFDKVLEQLAQNGLGALSELIRILVTQAMQEERAHYLGAGEYERTEERKGYANGYKPKTVKTSLGVINFAIPQVCESDFFFAHHYAAWERGANENTQPDGARRQGLEGDGSQPDASWERNRLGSNVGRGDCHMATNSTIRPPTLQQTQPAVKVELAWIFLYTQNTGYLLFPQTSIPQSRSIVEDQGGIMRTIDNQWHHVHLDGIHTVRFFEKTQARFFQPVRSTEESHVYAR